MVRWIYSNIEEVLVTILVTLMCVVVTLQVFFRLVLQNPLIWSEEMATTLFVWVVMIGASLALKIKEHFAVELLHSRLNFSDRQLGRMIVGVMLIIFSILVLFEGARITWQNMYVTTAAMEISRAYLYAALPVGGLLMLIRSFEILVRSWQEDEKDDEVSSKDEINDKTEISV